MSLRHAVLAALLEGEASGYELAKRFDVSVAEFWSATPQQLYRDLDRLETDGLVDARVVEQHRRPNKRVFSLTEAGLAELHTSTTEPARPPAIRDELMVKMQALDTGDQQTLRATVAARLTRSTAKLARYDRMRDKLLNGRDEDTYLRDSNRIGPYLTLMAGRMYEQAYITWAERTLAILDARQH
ncbi:PadR family transcriptional regulator [Actinoplanes friuliensis]|uniref:Transcriptional regulator, PadR family protein n=1 Tax=Actinoplanes friuliensis DSM 7358 TaxID=1246995 RepID=U5VV63_9ACTN|nr:PadR family transcriptional regulator [Actinoplanes friuliensis]AGZ39580.1 Transcriptional regulator, PadR family protein [Actinoplanes friuliensis DSM 7358]